MSVEGVHFERHWLQPEEIGYRAVAAALSDLAAVAASPIGVLVSLGLPSDIQPHTAARMMEGATAAAAGVKAVLLGGDITRTPSTIVVDVVVVGNALRPVLRSGAKPGDAIWVTGELGAAAAAVRAFSSGAAPDPAARLAFALPTPRTAEAMWLARVGVVNALIDLSDGLAGDLGHLAAASAVRIIADAAAVPIHPAARAAAANVDDALQLAFTGGEDYELCFAAAAGAVEPYVASFHDTFALRLSCIGSVTHGSGVQLRDLSGRVDELDMRGYDHLAERQP
jgi:thiamine-monophosphate kinase